MVSVITFNDRSQWFIPESMWRQRGFMDEIERRRVSFEEYISLLFSGEPGEYIVAGI